MMNDDEWNNVLGPYWYCMSCKHTWKNRHINVGIIHFGIKRTNCPKCHSERIKLVRRE